MQAKEEKEAREAAALFAKKAKIFALMEEGKSRRLSYFGRPAQQCRLDKRAFHSNRMRWEQQAGEQSICDEITSKSLTRSIRPLLP